MAHRTVGGRPLIHLPALADIARDDHPVLVIQKSAQVGVSELLVNLALWAADTEYAGRGNVLFLMPTQNQMDDFAQARLDRALQDSPYLRERLQPEPPRRKGADSKRLKRLGNGAIYLRGADSKRQIASVDADLVILDEFDQMEEGVIELARRRLASSSKGLLRIGSTPRYPEAGINALYLRSDQRRYYLPCPHCELEQPLTWDDNVDVKSAQVVCCSCRKPIDVKAPGRWVPQAPGNDGVHGYHLSRLYSPWANMKEMVEASQATTPVALQEFQNSDLGEAFAPPGGGLSLDVLNRCRGDYSFDDYAGQPCDMGVDVGLKLHVVIRERRDPERDRSDGPGSGRPRLWFAGQVDGFPKLEALMERYNVRRCVVDSTPELHLAREFAVRHKGRVWLAQYGRQQPGHDRRRGGTGEPDRYVVNRPEVLDETFQRFRDGVVQLPRDAGKLGGPVKQGYGEYYRELLALKRTLERDEQGNFVARWLDSGRDDHFAHAEAYCLLAGKSAGMPVFQREDIEKAFSEEVLQWQL